LKFFNQTKKSDFQKNLSQKELEKLIKNYIFRLLTKRDYAKQNLKFKIFQKFPNFPKEKIEQILENFEEKHYLDDLRFAENSARRFLENKKGEMKAREFLFSKGVSEFLINQILKKFFTKEANEKAIIEILQKKFGVESFEVFKTLNPLEKSKIQKFLYSRGFEKFEI